METETLTFENIEKKNQIKNAFNFNFKIFRAFFAIICFCEDVEPQYEDA